MDNLPYITYDNFSEGISQSPYYRDSWECMTEGEKSDLYYETHYTIDNQWEYIGDIINEVAQRAFPRNFDNILEDCWLTKGQTALLEKYNNIIPIELQAACISLGRDILSSMAIKEIIETRKKTGAKRIKDSNVELEFDKVAVEFNNSSTRFLKRFMSTYFAFNNQ